jgi:hypothetical protein
LALSGGCVGHIRSEAAPGIWWVEARSTAKHPTGHSPTTKNVPFPKFDSARLETWTVTVACLTGHLLPLCSFPQQPGRTKSLPLTQSLCDSHHIPHKSKICKATKVLQDLSGSLSPPPSVNLPQGLSISCSIYCLHECTLSISFCSNITILASDPFPHHLLSYRFIF